MIPTILWNDGPDSKAVEEAVRQVAFAAFMENIGAGDIAVLDRDWREEFRHRNAIPSDVMETAWSALRLHFRARDRLLADYRPKR